MEHSLEMMLSRMEDILEDNAFTAYLYGSVTMEDFRWGWSDIDLLCLTEREFSASQARRLAGLRQELQAAEPDNPGISAYLKAGFCPSAAMKPAGRRTPPTGEPADSGSPAV